MTDEQFVKELFRDYTGPASMETVRAMKRLLDQRTQERDEARRKNANLVEENLRLVVEMGDLMQTIQDQAEIIERLEARR